MVSIEYRELVQLDAVVARKKVVEIYYHQADRNISETARVCGLSRHTVRKWLGRFFSQGAAGLKDYSRRPHHMPRKTPDAVEELVVGIRKATNYGSRRIAQSAENRALSFLTAPCKKFSSGATNISPEKRPRYAKPVVATKTF